MKAIVFIKTQNSGSSREAIKAAKRMGYETIVFTNLMSRIEHQALFPDITKMIYCNLNHYDTLKEQIMFLQKEDYEIEAILSFIDPYVHTASLLADEFGIGHFSTEAIHKMQNKILSRDCLKNTEYIPKYQIVNQNHPVKNVQLPLILKNPESTGSKDVYLVTNEEDYHYYFNEMMHRTNEFIVEEFINGPQFLIETLVINKKVHIIAIIEQEIMMHKGHSIVVGYSFKHFLNKPFRESLNKAVKDIILCHGMENGACHLEMRYVRHMWKLIEINPRISGAAMNNIIRFSIGLNLVEETLNLALNKPCHLSPKFEIYTFTQYLTCPYGGRLEKVCGRNNALNSPGVIDVFIKPIKGQYIHPPISMGYRYAHVVASGLSELGAKINAKNAASHIKFHIIRDEII